MTDLAGPLVRAKALRETCRKLIDVALPFTGAIGLLSAIGSLALMSDNVGAGVVLALASVAWTVIVFAGLYFAKWQVYVSIEADREAARRMIIERNDDEQPS